MKPKFATAVKAAASKMERLVESVAEREKFL
jgi:hypothetical protein